MAEILEFIEAAEDLDSTAADDASDDMLPNDAIRFHIGKILEAIETSTASQKAEGKEHAPAPRTLTMHLPHDAQQVLVFVVAGSGDPTATVNAHFEKPDIRGARVRIVEKQGEGNTSTVLVVDEWGGAAADIDERQENVVIDIADDRGSEDEIIESDEESIGNEDSGGDVAEAELDPDDDDWVPNSRKKSGKRSLANTNSSESPAKRVRTDVSVTCSKCNVKFATEAAFEYHPCQRETEEKHFVCKFCGQEYKDSSAFWDHYRDHAGMKRWQAHRCADCPKSFSTPELLEAHCIENNHVSSVQCSVCGEKYSSRNQLRKHKRDVHFLKHVCRICQESFLLKQQLVKHCESEHTMRLAKHKCHLCSEVFTDKNALWKHLRDLHFEEMHTCVFCEKMFIKKSAMLAHQAQHLADKNAKSEVEPEIIEENNVVEGDGKSYVCEKCGHAFDTLLAFQKHSITHSERLYPCSQCSIVMRTEEDLLRHQQRHEAKLICDQCGRQYTQMRELRKHMATHSETRPFPCGTCGFRFFSEDRLKSHQRIHAAKRFVCNLCPMKFTDKEHLRRHLKSHARTNRQRISACVFHCLMCPETFDSPTRLIQHYDTEHPLSEFHCVLCDTRVATFALLKYHFRSTHQGKVINCCRVCGDAFDNKPELESHRSTTHHVPRRQQIIVNTKVFCAGCEQTFNAPKLYQEHLETNEQCREVATASEVPDIHFKCSICGEEFPTNSHLVTHSAIHGGNFPFSCHICGTDLANAQEVIDHLSQHLAIGIWSCLKCNRTLSTRQSLRMHMAGHGTVAPYTCPTCNKKFNWRSALTWHMNVHTGEEPFECKRCKATFKQPNQLKAHLLAHDGRKMYECSECGKTFWLRSALITHLGNHVMESQGENRPAPTFDCNICGKVFNAKSYLSNHLRTHKGEKGLLKKLFACERCKRTFTTRAHLIIHEQTHDGVGLVCPVCQRKFKTLSWLQIHMRIHTSESPVCPICNKSFTIQRSLEEHMAFHDEQNVEVTCPTCNTKFRSERSFLRHKGKCLEGFSGQVCRVCGLGFTTAEKYNEHAPVCNVKQNRRTTENVESTEPLEIVKVEQSVEEEPAPNEQHVVIMADNSFVSEEVPVVVDEAREAIFVPDDGNQLLIQNVLEAIEGEKFVVSNTDGNAELDQLIEGQMPTELILDGPEGKVRVQLVFQTVG